MFCHKELIKNDWKYIYLLKHDILTLDNIKKKLHRGCMAKKKKTTHTQKKKKQSTR